jgi:endo-1,4-beta-mannosidase
MLRGFKIVALALVLVGCAGAWGMKPRVTSSPSGIDWPTIFALPSNDVCSIHVYSPYDELNVLPAVASYCSQMGKPWITEEFGWKQSIGDRQRARNFVRIHELQREHHSAGVGFWNLGPQTNDPDPFDVNPSTPMTLRVVQEFTQMSGTLARRPMGGGFVTTCGRQLCIDGRPWLLYGASAYRGLADPLATVRRVQDAGLNTLRIVNFLDEEHGQPATAPFDESSWQQVDRLIATAAAAHLRVILDLSTYRNLLLHAGVNPYTTDWGPVVDFVTSRRNTVTGVRYRDDPTIALISLAGEVEPFEHSDTDVGVERAHITTFFTRTLGQWKAADPRHLVNTGGLLHLDIP